MDASTDRTLHVVADDAVPLDEAGRRRRLRELDCCLEVLEEAHMRDIRVVSDRLSRAMAPYVGLVPGAAITDAIEEIWHVQESMLLPEPTEIPAPPGPVTSPHPRAA